MIGYGDHLADVVRREFQEKVVFGDDARYVVKGTWGPLPSSWILERLSE